MLAALAADAKRRDTPVVMISSVEEIGSAARCVEMGAEDSLFKPVNAVLLRARVEASLEKTRLRDQQRGLFRKFAAQLEAHTKMLGRPFLTDAHTREALSGAMRWKTSAPGSSRAGSNPRGSTR